MKRAVAPVLVLFLCCAGCGDTHESLTKEYRSTMSKVIVVLQGVKDEASAQAAKPKLKALAQQLNDIQSRMAKLPAPTDAQIKSTADKYAQDMQELQSKLMAEVMRIGLDPKLRGALDDLDQDFSKTRG